MPKVLITGASSGIGLATALEFARAGHTVLATMRNPSKTPQLAEISRTENLALTVHRLDVDSDESVRQAFGQAGEIDVLVNNAGVGPHGAIEEIPWDALRGAMETNYFGALRCIRAVLPSMRERRAGTIVNVTSVAGRIASAPMGAYTASKFALEAASEVLAQEVKAFGIRVAIVEPGIIDTPMARDIGEGAKSAYPHSARFANMFRAALANPVPPTVVAVKIREIVEGAPGKLRHPIGADAEPFLQWRASLTDEEHIAWGAMEDDAWYDYLRNVFGLDARPKQG